MPPKSRFVDYSVTYNREARAKEAFIALKLSGHNPKKGILLDLGCGGGFTTKWFAKAGIYAVGIEIIKAFFGEAKNKPDCLEYLRASGVDLPFLNDVLEHISYVNAEEAFKQIHRVLDDDGKLYVSVASKFEVREPHSNVLFLSWFPRWIYAPIVRKIFHEDVYPYTFKRFSQLAKQTGFSFENVTCLYVANKVNNLNYVGNTLLRPVIKALNRIGLTRSPGFLKFIEPFGVLIFICKKR
jgi:SAM-dependent methyltransferase